MRREAGNPKTKKPERKGATAKNQNLKFWQQNLNEQRRDAFGSPVGSVASAESEPTAKTVRFKDVEIVRPKSNEVRTAFRRKWQKKHGRSSLRRRNLQPDLKSSSTKEGTAEDVAKLEEQGRGLRAE